MRFPSWVGQYIEIPYTPGGRDRAGCDCWGLTRLIQLEQFGVELPGFTYDPSDIRMVGRLISQEVPLLWDEVKEPEVGDVALFRVSGDPYHVATVIGGGWMLHITKGINSTRERLLESPMWRPRFLGFYRPRGR